MSDTHRPTNLPEAIKVAAKKHGKQQHLVEFLNLSQGTVSKVVRGAYKVLPKDTLESLCTKWPDKETGLEVLSAYITDEIIRAGRSPDEISISIHGDNPQARELDEQLRLIRDWLPGDPDIRGIIEFLADAAARERAAALRSPDACEETDMPVDWPLKPNGEIAAGTTSPSNVKKKKPRQ